MKMERERSAVGMPATRICILSSNCTTEANNFVSWKIAQISFLVSSF